ncbi:hypothetical protein [Xenorhabdus hominickii]|uniref:Acetyltransferase n=1 Tax=Xenorhabdus hominickii TaxID=351679 RepID=A0A1V0M4Q9_XENHO|nr:hypothetical protein [Xenorhabdus hominickii]ARD69861.1 hypothetical protein [Xenorhabdus hominickii]PHM51436.1 acetyltransferase [Xenorhabdus hominickii]
MSTARVKTALLGNARQRAGAYALVVDSKDKKAASFYSHHGLIQLPDEPLMLFFPLANVQK